VTKGFVYIMANQAMPGIVKIGRTVRDPEVRANDLYVTGVPVPFRVVHSVLAPDCVALERVMHGRFDYCRVSDAREFFAVGEDEAVDALESALCDAVQEILDEFLPDHTFAQWWEVMPIATVERLAGELCVAPPDIKNAFAQITADELRPALARAMAFWKNAAAKAKDWDGEDG
jgi:Lon protease-like protein